MTNYKKWLWSSQKDKAALSTSKGLEYCPNTTYLNLTRIASLSTWAEPDARTLKDEQGALGTWTRSLSMTGSLLERKLLRRCSQCQLQVKTCKKEKIAKKKLQLPVLWRSNWMVLWRSDWLHHLWMWLSSSSLSHQIQSFTLLCIIHRGSQNYQC